MEAELLCDRPGTRVRLRVVDGDIHKQMSEVRTAIPLGDLHRLRVWVAVVIEPRLVVEPRGLDDQRVAFPSTFRVSHPRGLRVFGKGVTRVEEDLAERG